MSMYCRATKIVAPLFISVVIHVLLISQHADARKHHLEVPDDVRPYIALSTFGFYTGGHLDVKLSKLHIQNEDINDLLGFSLDKTTIDQMNPYLDSHQNKCILEEQSVMQHSGPILFFLLDLKNEVIKIQCSPEWKNQHITRERPKRQSSAEVSNSALFIQRRKRENEPHEEENDQSNHGLPDDGLSDDDDLLEQPIEDVKPPVVKPSVPTVVQKSENAVGAAAAAPKIPTPGIITPLNSGSASADLMAAPAAPAVATSKPEILNKKQHPEVDSRTLGNRVYSSNEDPFRDICSVGSWPLQKTVINGQNYYNMSFYMIVASSIDEGLYNLYFHSCPNYINPKPVSFTVDIEERNDSNYLSAGEMPLPALYFIMSVLFFLSGLFWVFILKKSKHNVYKIHYIMAILVFLKSLSLMFHAINYHFIEIRGEHVEAWAILYYITHLLKGAVLFITIVLIGTGWTFIKHILSDKDKKIFMIVIPLQVLANVAEIIIDESEESDVEFRTWRNIFIFVDLLCCGAILFPIVWSIRHLHEASATDGKAAINLRKLKLFRQFYIMIVCYIYFTRIIVYLLKMTVAFQYAWLDEMFHEMATYVFFVLTGYKFRPASSHPYFTIPEDDEDDEVEVLTESGLTQGLHRTKAQNRNAASKTTTIIVEGDDEERENLITKRESSHEYD